MIKKGDLQQKIAEGENVRITDNNGLSLVVENAGMFLRYPGIAIEK